MTQKCPDCNEERNTEQVATFVTYGKVITKFFCNTCSHYFYTTEIHLPDENEKLK
jgi:hypothetical protein